jgi:hypothetical protein
MAKDIKKGGAVAKGNNKIGDEELENLLQSLIDSGDFAELRLERTIYKPELCGEVPLIGHVIQLLDMPPLDDGREWQAFVFRTTHVTKGVDRTGDIVDVGVDEEIIIPATWQLASALARFANDAAVMFEVALLPKEKISIGGGKNMWTYRAAVGRKPPVARTGPYLLQQDAPINALGAGMTANGTKFDKDGVVAVPVS